MIRGVPLLGRLHEPLECVDEDSARVSKSCQQSTNFSLGLSSLNIFSNSMLCFSAFGAMRRTLSKHLKAPAREIVRCSVRCTLFARLVFVHH
jgi:hypothetical protein